MKLPTNLHTLTLSAGMLFLTASVVNAQNCDCREALVNDPNQPAVELTYIGEDDYSYFLNIKRLSKYSNIVYDGLSLNSSGVESYTLTSHNSRIDLDATYDKDGKLIDASLVTEDSHLPRSIMVYLISNGFRDWTMTGNKTYVTDFDAQKTEYEVQVQQDDVNQTLFFDHAGKRINKLSPS